jgi:hypothetical protein
MRLSVKTLTSSIVALVVGSSLLLMASPAQAATSAGAVSTSSRVSVAATGFSGPVTGTFTDSTGGTGTFAGTFTPRSFSVAKRVLTATGTVTGTLTDSAGTVLGTATQTVSTPVQKPARSSSSTAAVAAASCQILDLSLAPINLNLLGLVVHTDTIHLNITAQSGPGNLLGNLLCAVTGLLNSGSLGTVLAGLLNQIIAILNGL